MKLDVQPINCGNQLLVSDADTGKMYGVIETKLNTDCIFGVVELLDAVWLKIGIDGINVRGGERVGT